MLGPSTRAADSGTLPNGAQLTLTSNNLASREQQRGADEPPIQDPTSLWQYFNMAHC